jgi:hypothetical protein
LSNKYHAKSDEGLKKRWKVEGEECENIKRVEEKISRKDDEDEAKNCKTYFAKRRSSGFVNLSAKLCSDTAEISRDISPNP